MPNPMICINDHMTIKWLASTNEMNGKLTSRDTVLKILQEDFIMINVKASLTKLIVQILQWCSFLLHRYCVLKTIFRCHVIMQLCIRWHVWFGTVIKINVTVWRHLLPWVSRNWEAFGRECCLHYKLRSVYDSMLREGCTIHYVGNHAHS